MHVYPRAIYANARKKIEDLHNVTFLEFMKTQKGMFLLTTHECVFTSSNVFIKQ